MSREFNPFGKDLEELVPKDLFALREIEEGYFIEYKQEAVKAKDIAKEIAAFANANGGWLFIGIAESRQSGPAGGFPGIPREKAHGVRESVVSTVKSNISPTPEIRTALLDGPCKDISLEDGKSIVVVQILEGEEPPYVHNSGKIYRRHHANSDAEADRTALDDLYRKFEQTKSRLARTFQNTIDRQFTPQNVPRIKLLFLSDPHGLKKIRSTFDYKDFSSVIREDSKRTGPYYFDNVYTETDGFVARQVYENSPLGFTMNWKYGNDCSSLVMFPLRPIMFSPDAPVYYKHLEKFLLLCPNKGNEEQKAIVDISLIDAVVHAAVVQHRALLNHETEVPGTVYAKAFVEGFAGLIPFVDADCYITHVTKYGLPVVQTIGFMAPDGIELADMLKIELPKQDDVDRKHKYREASSLLVKHILTGLGIPPDLYLNNIAQFKEASDRSAIVHHTVSSERIA